ncbi:hypothetical protein BH23ACT2_BH23ACT2_02430 [soil metagenome]
MLDLVAAQPVEQGLLKRDEPVLAGGYLGELCFDPIDV